MPIPAPGDTPGSPGSPGRSRSAGHFRCRHTHTHRCGYTMIGLLITMVCILILFTISMSALNRAITGEGSPRAGTARTVQDQMLLKGLFQSMLAGAQEQRDSTYLVPSALTGSGDRREDITANFYSAMIALQYTVPENLISHNEYSGYVYMKHDYDHDAYEPARGSFWDPTFKADLDRESHVSFAHMPMFGERFERGWQPNMDGRVVLLGNRGPRDGVDNPNSMTYGRDGTWGGNVVFGDGSVRFYHEFTPGGLTYQRDGESHPDNIFRMDDGPGGRDAILSFTRQMTADGPVLQFD